MAVTPIAEAVISSLKCRTPRAGEWVRVNPDPSWQSEAVLARDQDGEYYLVTPELADELLEARPDRVHRSMLFVAANSEGVGFLWPVKLPVLL